MSTFNGVILKMLSNTVGFGRAYILYICHGTPVIWGTKELVYQQTDEPTTWGAYQQGVRGTSWGQCVGLWIERSGFEPWLGSLCLVLARHFTLAVPLSTQVYDINVYQHIKDPSKPHLCFCLHPTFSVLYFTQSISK